MKKLITLILSIGFGLFCSFDEAYAMERGGKGGGNRGGRAGNRGSRGHKQQDNQEKAIGSNSNQLQQPPSLEQPSAAISNVQIVEELRNSVEKLELSGDQSLPEPQNLQQGFVEVPLSDVDDSRNPTVTILEAVSDQLGNNPIVASEHYEPQNQVVIIESSAPQDLENESEQKEIIGDNQGSASSLPEIYEPMQPGESGQQLLDVTPENAGVEVEKEMEIEEELVDVSDNQVVQAQVSKLFAVAFKNNQEKEVFAQCNNYNFCDFMLNALAKITEPETVSMVRHYGFGLGHVPLLLVWSCHLFDRLEKSRTYCMETQDLKDILMLILIIDLRAQVDAACIEYMKKNYRLSNLLAVQTDAKVIETSTASAPLTAGYLKGKLATLWCAKIQDMYNKKKLPCYTTILQKVKQIANEWQDEQLQSPIWVCSVKRQSYMLFNNFLAGWPADRFGNWWNPEQSLIIACQGCDYSDIRKPTAEKVLAELEKYTSWSEYFGDIYKLVKVDNAEYDSDGGF